MKDRRHYFTAAITTWFVRLVAAKLIREGGEGMLSFLLLFLFKEVKVSKAGKVGRDRQLPVGKGGFIPLFSFIAH